MTITQEQIAAACRKWDEYVESMGSIMGDTERMAQEMRDMLEQLASECDALKSENRYWSGEYDVILAGRADEYDRAEKEEAEVEKWKQAFAAQSKKLQSVLHIEGVRLALNGNQDD